MSLDSSVGIAKGYGLDGRGSIFLYSTASRRALGSTQPPIQWVPGALSPGREVDHSSPSSAKVKHVELYLHRPIRFHDVLPYLSYGNSVY
jgi:hypothetical protein